MFKAVMFMKGPGMRTDLDVRRVWECPRCGRMRRIEGHITAVRCGCQPDGSWMALKEGRRQVRAFSYPATEGQFTEQAAPADGASADVSTEPLVVPVAEAASAVETPAPEPGQRAEMDG